MKRSQINAQIREADAFLRLHGWYLPPFAYWTPEDWRERRTEAAHLISARVGWDITDFGEGNYARKGLFLFTVRNGDLADLRSGRGRVYCEKLLIADIEQMTPLHYHWSKTEDIINRAGGVLAVQVFNTTADHKLADTPVELMVDGLTRRVEAGAILELQPGESVTLVPGVYHAFWAVHEKVLIGEVSTVNDDANDNKFFESIGRFPTIEEDEPALHLLVSDYDRL